MSGFGQTCLLAIACAFLASCADLMAVFDQPQDQVEELEPQFAPELSPLVDFLSLAKAGQTAELADPSSGETVRVVAGRLYAAASGRRCRRFTAATPPGFAGLSAGLACKDASGRWRITELIVNPEVLEEPR